MHVETTNHEDFVKSKAAKLAMEKSIAAVAKVPHAIKVPASCGHCDVDATTNATLSATAQDFHAAVQDQVKSSSDLASRFAVTVKEASRPVMVQADRPFAEIRLSLAR